MLIDTIKNDKNDRNNVENDDIMVDRSFSGGEKNQRRLQATSQRDLRSSSCKRRHEPLVKAVFLSSKPLKVHFDDDVIIKAIVRVCPYDSSINILVNVSANAKRYKLRNFNVPWTQTRSR